VLIQVNDAEANAKVFRQAARTADPGEAAEEEKGMADMRMNRKYVKYRLPPSVPGLAKNVKS